MSALNDTSSAASVDQEESFITALATISNRSRNPMQSSVKMFPITDTSPPSPLVKQRPLQTPHAKFQGKNTITSPVSYTSNITQSPALSHSATSDDAKAVHNPATFDSEKQVQFTPIRTFSTAHSSKVSRIPLSARGTSQASPPDQTALVEFETPKQPSTKTSTRKAPKSITADFTPPPSKIPIRNRRTPNYARSTKASRRRSEWAKTSTVPNESDTGTNGLKAIRLSFSKTIPVSPEVLHRTTGRIRKIPSPKKSKSFKPNPTPRYLHKPRPTVRSTAKSEAVRQGPVQPAPVPPPTPFFECKPVPTISKPFNLGSVELHEIRVKQIQARRKLEEEEDQRRRLVRPVKLHREILEGPTFVPNLDNKVLTVPVDPLPWAERRERTLAFEAAQRVRIEEMYVMKEQAQKMRELAEEEKLREEYERNKFRARPVPRSHYKPDTPPTRRGPLAVMYEEEEIARREENEEDNELRSFFSKLDISASAQSTSSRENHNKKLRRSLSLKPTERKDLYSIVEQRGVIEPSANEWDEDLQTIEQNKENIVPKSEETHKTKTAGRKQQRQSGFGAMRLFNEIRNTLLGR
ncbi:hypothetical protein FGB62_32g140 [Gracilaria domingensis]|nr:hypothetical protein FGB62_32g140 [Gracilaria domingensis]